MDYPIIALIGRVNVGKSTLFNRLVKKQQALVADFEGLTVDRQYGQGLLGDFEYAVIDTGGFSQSSRDKIQPYILTQIDIAIEEANILFLVLDGAVGLLAEDLSIIERVRRLGKQVYLVVNKLDRVANQSNELMNEFYRLGIENTFFISATNTTGCLALLEKVHAQCETKLATPILEHVYPKPFIGLVGKPNAGKSTLINQLLGQDRMVTSDIPGTTRESVFNRFNYQNRDYTLIDTPGVRKKNRVHFWVERLSISSTIKIIYQCDVVLVVIDVTDGVTEQDVNLINLSVYHDKEVIILLNKNDILDDTTRYQLQYSLDKKLPHLKYLHRFSLCALRAYRLGNIFKAIDELIDHRQMQFPTHRVNQVLNQAVLKNQPPVYNNRVIRLKYAHQMSVNQHTKGHALRFLIHGSNAKYLPNNYQRYLTNYFRNALDLKHNLITLEFQNSQNRYIPK